ncbi:MAG: aminotransferase class I/II-fold pyridoxal phosphate-dependent enzyme [Chitinophagales bacterium]|nr:aminotransferase class I/II-fold pyridoxal phosphate-dependent enzyme [Chitinophagales bacterium]
MQGSNLKITTKLPEVSTTIFTVMSALANEQNAINLSQGFPHFQPDLKLQSLVKKYMEMGLNQYAPMAGIIPLRKAIAEKYRDLYVAEIDFEKEITITAGGTQAIFTSILSVVNKDDEVIIFEPAYDCYAPTVELVGGKPIFIKLRAPDFRIPWDEVRAVLGSKSRMIIINSPHNPTASLLDSTDIDALTEITNNSDLLILSDEVYEHTCFDGREHESILRYPHLLKRSFVVFSFGKTYHSTGWKLGYCIAPEALMKEFRKVHQFNVFSVNTPFQYAFADFVKEKEQYKSLNNIYQQKRDLFLNLLKDSKFSALPCHGTYFQLLSFEKISQMYDVDFARELTIEHKVASIPISVFYHDKMDQKILRFCFAKDDDTLIKAAEKLNSI